jgi:mono/diheme cytochrome c family protein
MNPEAAIAREIALPDENRRDLSKKALPGASAWFHAAALLVAALTSAGAEAGPQAFLKAHCFECHDADSQKGGLNLAALKPDFAAKAAADTWEKVLDRVESGEMPPKKKARPPEKDRDAFLAAVGAQLTAADTQRHQREGRVAMRRLNRFEYQNTIRDLLGIEVNVMELLPEDGQAHGFDKLDAALTLSPVQVEKYLEAADLALDTALGIGPQPKFVQERFAATNLIAGWETKSQRVLDAGAMVIFNSGYSPTELRRFRAPAPGFYRIRISAAGYQTAGQPQVFRVYAGNFGVGGKTKVVGYFEVPADKPKVVEVTTHLDARGDTLKVIPYGTIPWQNTAATYTGPGVNVEWIEVEGPLDAKEWPPANRAKLLGTVSLERGTAGDAEEVVRGFAQRCFRRPVSHADVAPYVKLAADRLATGMKFEDALRVGLKAVLVSPRFLLLDEKPGRLDDFALASRLSYFLWSSMPDAVLLDAAAKGDLGKPAVLRAQVERMLNDARARRFTEDFTGQWLGLRNIEFTTPDARLYPEFDELLQVSMVRETHAFFDELLRRDLSLLNFVESDFAMLNARLAKHYGIPGVAGLDVRRVALRPEWHRGGVLTHASVMKVTANGTTTSPVLRGVWMLDRVLGRPAPPPPKNVAAIEPDIRGAKSFREQLAKHRDVESCAVCHVRIDPVGFALENYDVIGGWRERYRISPERNQRGVEYTSLRVNERDMRIAIGPRVDASDALPDGRRFRNLAELKSLLLEDKDAIARGLAEKLLIYATGHELEFADRRAAKDLVAKVKSKNYGLRSLVNEVVQSEVFRSK